MVQKCIYQGKTYQILDHKGFEGFSLPVSEEYVTLLAYDAVVIYAVKEGRLMVDQVQIQSCVGEYPKINGRWPERDEYGATKVTEYEHCMYSDVGMEIVETATLLIVCDDSDNTMDPKSKMPELFRFKEVKELRFSGGELESVVDFSEDVEYVRRLLSARDALKKWL